MRVRTIDVDGIDVVLCLKFDHRASAGEVDSFRHALIERNDVHNSLESIGPFDLIVELVLPDFATYTERMKQLADPFARLVERYEACFINRRHIPLIDEPEDLWIPTREGFQRVRCRDIDIVRAEGDYVRISCGQRSWLMSMTMAAILDRLDRQLFLHLHRSAIVRRDFIDRLIHRQSRWIAELTDGTAQRVAKSHVATTMKMLRGGPAPIREGSPTGSQQAEPSGESAEIRSALGANSGTSSASC